MTIFFIASRGKLPKFGNMKFYKTTTVICLIMVNILLIEYLPAQAPPDEFPRAQSLFARAQGLMRENDYLAAIDVYQELVKGYRESQYRDIYNYALARAYYLSGDYRQAYVVLSSYYTLFPNSHLVPYAYHLLANCTYRMGQLERAFEYYLQAYRMTGDRDLRNLSRRSLLAAVENGYFPPDSILVQVPQDLECPLKGRMAFLMSGYWSQEQIDSLLFGCTEEPADKQASTIPPPQAGHPRVGLILPLSGPFGKYGQSILDGAMLAAEILQEENQQIEMLVYNSRADHLTAARVSQALIETEVDLVIGPLLSNIAATAASVLSVRHIPLLIPAASQAGITELSPYCFQLTPNMVTIGRGMAQYAAKHRGMTSMAVIAPTSLDEMSMAEAFVQEAKKMGIDIFAYEKFRTGETDFGPYIKDIKEAVLGPMKDSTFYISLQGDTLESGEMPVSFDGIFIPATEGQLYLLLPQLNFYRITAAYFGSDEWNTDKVLKLGDKVLGDAVFYSGKSAMRQSSEYDKFATAFDTKYGEQPDYLAARGYDAINIFAAAVREGRNGPSNVVAYLKLLNDYRGASGKITFGAGRSNLELPLFKFEEGLVKPLVEQPVVKEPEDQIQPDSVEVEIIKYGW